MQQSISATLFDETEPASKSGKVGRTPLMRQYFKIKDDNPNAVLLFRMGDFYETFDDDAKLIAPLLGLTLTKRANGKASNVPLAGFPYHSLDTYLPKLVRAGLRVAICEQVEDAKTAKTIVRREVIEVVTPGITFRDELLTPQRSNYLAGVVQDDKSGIAGLAILDATTGDFSVAEVEASEIEQFLDGVQPTELIVPADQREQANTVQSLGILVTPVDDWIFATDYSHQVLIEHFKTHSLKGFGVDDLPVALRAAGAVLHYVSETQKGRVPPIRTISNRRADTHMLLDSQTKRNLELVESPGAENHSLIAILDRTRTPMGARLLRSWILQPLLRSSQINERLDAVSALIDPTSRNKVNNSLAGIGDIERLAIKNATGRTSPRELVSLADSLSQIIPLKDTVTDFAEGELHRLAQDLKSCDDVINTIRSGLSDDPPATLAAGGAIRSGFNAELDELRSLSTSGKDIIAKIQAEESAKTGITSLKVGYNRVFGYYLEVTNTHKDKVPEYFIRKQTLVNAERYITADLKEHEEKILSAEDRIGKLEAQLFEELRLEVDRSADLILDNAKLVASIDALASYGEVAHENQYVRPIVDDSLTLDIEDGRHPIVEHALEAGDPFIPNSVAMDNESEQILVITGPNMAGKSVVLRQTGLIVLMAQIGSFVPASAAHIGVVDRIFTRVGASDNLSAGESTFLVEMNEAANILNNATQRSLILLDEVGRGTSTFDGLSIAWAIVEYLHENERVSAKTMFATHYHELNELASRMHRITNYRVLVQEHAGRVIFLRKLVKGGADHSYGIEVARMAGLPEVVIARAREVLLHLESTSIVVGESHLSAKDGGVGIAPTVQANSMSNLGEFDANRSAEDKTTDIGRMIADDLRNLDLNRLTPVEALVKLNELKHLADRD